MTVCIAALYDGCGGCYLISDQMTTAHFPIGYEFETDDISKIIKLGDKASPGDSGEGSYSCGGGQRACLIQ